MNLLELNEKQEISIQKVRYEVLNMTKFKEKSSFWIEYKLRRLEDNKIYYLNVELSMKVILYEIIEDTTIEPQMLINFQGQEYELYEKGIEKVETYYGITDVGLNEEASYYEYVNKNDGNLFISIEKWKNQLEVSVGKRIKIKDIK